MGIYRIKPWFQRQLQPITDSLVKNKISPDWMTYAAILVAAGMSILIYLSTTNRYLLLFVAAGVPIRLAMNALDGQVSRALGLADPMGEVKNELGDRLADMLIFVSFCFVPEIPLAISITALCITFLVAYVGILSKALTGVREYAGIMGKPDRMTVIAIMAVLVAITAQWYWLSIGLVIVIILGVYTLWLRVAKIYERV
jgi:phosphatidylglycerophosphate synthase